MSLPLEKARAAAKGKLVETASGTLHVRVTGDGPDVLLIHGVTDNGATWDRIAPTLAARARVHAIDLPGHGLSSIPDHPLTVVEMARAMSAYLDAAKIERCVACGNSLGGGVTLALAHAEPKRVTAIAPLGSIGTPFTIPVGLRALRVTGVGEFMRLMAHTPRLARPLMRGMFHRDYPIPPDALEAYWSGWRVRERPPYIRRLMRALETGEIVALLPEIRAVAHIVHGESDKIIPPRVGRELAAAIPGAKLTILARTGHAPQNERPDETARIILELVSAASGSRSAG